MKKYIYLIALFLVTLVNYSQTGITYQAVILKPNGVELPGVNNTAAPLINTAICLEFTILDSNAQTEYLETITTVTDAFGMVNTLIGSGTQTGGYATSFANIDWNNAEQKALKVALDDKGLCTNFLEISTQNFSSVPFAFSATNAANVTGIVPIEHGGTNATTVIGAKTNLGLENVDNTSDLNKPISIATQNALNLKENSANKSTDGTLPDVTNTKFPTELAVKTYVDASSAVNAAALAAEVVRATTAENTLTTNLAAEVTRAITAEATKEDAVNKSTDGTLATNSDIKFPTEQAVKTYVDGSSAANAAALAAEVLNLTNADTTLQSNINNLSTTVTANANTAANADANLQSNINNLTATVTANANTAANADTTLQSNINNLTATVTANADTAANADTTLQSNINNLTATVTANANTAANADTTLQSNINNLSATVTANATTAANADATLQSNINNLSATVTANANTAANVDATLQSNINNLTATVAANAATAANADTTLQSNINNLSATVNANATTAANATALKENSANKSTDVTLADVTNIKFPTELAVKTYVDGKIFDATPSFAIGTTGTDFNITTAGTATTFNIPDASLTNRGVVTTTDQTFAGAKTFSSDVTVNGNAKISGKLSANGGNASGINSTALGSNTTASGNGSTAMGTNTTASGIISTAMGKGTTAIGFSSTAMGNSTIASENYSTAMGFATTASGGTSTAMGSETNASGDFSTAMGLRTTATANFSTAMGFETTASRLASTAIGYRTAASGPYSTALGYNSTASGFVSTAMGGETTASGSASTAMGDRATASGGASTAMGFGTNAKSFAETAIGNNNTDYTPNSTNSYNATDRLFVIGNGVDENNKSDAMVVLKNGNTTINGTTTATSFVKAGGLATDYLMADGTTSAGPDLSTIQTNFVTTTANSDNITNVNAGNVGIGTDLPSEKLDVNGNLKVRGTLNNMNVGNLGLGGDNVVFGNSAYNNGALGSNNTANGARALALNTTGSDNTAIGKQALYSNTTGFLNTANGGISLFNNTSGYANTANGLGSLVNNAVGNLNTANGYNALQSNTTGSNNTAVGSFSNVSSGDLTNATAFGFGAVVDESNKIQLGNSAVTAVNTSGTYTGAGFKTSNGTANEYLMANGTTSAGPDLSTIQTNFVTTTADPTNISNVNAGNVGIGTYAPTEKLDVAGNIKLSGTINGLTIGANNSGNNMAIGIMALNAGSSANSIAIGPYSMINTHGISNTAVGLAALAGDPNGSLSSQNTALGTGAIERLGNSTGRNTGIGYGSLGYTTTGDSNTGIGAGSMNNNTTGNYNTGLGTMANVASGDLTNATAVGFAAVVDESNKIQLGNADVTAVNTSGTYTGAGFKTSNGTANEYLMADGTTSTGPDLSTIQTNFVTTTADPTNISNVNVGNVGIGTDTPTEKLDVAGNAKISGKLSANGGNASGNFSVAMGLNTIASAFASTAMGDSTYASGSSSTAMGYVTIASGFASTAMGDQTEATGDFSTAMGLRTTATANYSTAMGNSTTASNDYATAMGNGTTASGFASTAIGYITTASGTSSTAMGSSTNANSFAETAIGTNNTDYTPNSTTFYNAADRLFVIGNGVDQGNKSDAMVVLKNGNTTINGEVTVTKIKIPNGQANEYLMADGTTSSATASDNEADEEFVAAGAETSFILPNTPRANSKVKMYINGIRISKTAYTVVGANLTYNPAFNGNYTITANDRIQFEYFY